MTRDRFSECKAALALAFHAYDNRWTMGGPKRRDNETWDAYVIARLDLPDVCASAAVVIHSYADRVLCANGIKLRMWFFNLKR